MNEPRKYVEFQTLQEMLNFLKEKQQQMHEWNELHGTIEGVQAQWEHAALEARLLAREYVEL
jgi:hypothetical protein